MQKKVEDYKDKIYFPSMMKERIKQDEIDKLVEDSL